MAAKKPRVALMGLCCLCFGEMVLGRTNKQNRVSIPLYPFLRAHLWVYVVYCFSRFTSEVKNEENNVLASVYLIKLIYLHCLGSMLVSCFVEAVPGRTTKP